MIDDALTRWRVRADAALEQALPALNAVPNASPERLHAAMRHGALGGGKRIRPLLVYATGTALGVAEAELDAAAVAVELIHCYSLIHDDLPAMDNDSLRRGQPTVHVAFDDATAILAGDALQSLAFEVLATAPQTPECRIAMLAELARAAGAAGMCGGQALDMAATGEMGEMGSENISVWNTPKEMGSENISQSDLLEQLECSEGKCSLTPFLAFLEHLHALKTGALLRCAVRLGAIAANASAPDRDALDRYANALGLAFQIRDDLLDIESDTATLGKTIGKDAAQAKMTFPALIGVDASRARLQALAVQMHSALDEIRTPTAVLATLAHRVIQRTH